MRRFIALLIVCAVVLGILLALRPPMTPAERYNQRLLEWYERAAEYQSTPPYTQGPYPGDHLFASNNLTATIQSADPTGPACPLWIDIDSLLKVTNETEVNHNGNRTQGEIHP